MSDQTMLLMPYETALDDSEDRRGNKAESAYRTISEVANDLHVPQHVLRFWESKFKQISPLKRGGGRRYYRPQDIDLIKRIHHLLYTQGYTIKGVQKLLAKDRLLQQTVPDLSTGSPRVVVADVAPQLVASKMDTVANTQTLSAQHSSLPFQAQIAPLTMTGLTPTQRAELQQLLGRIKALRDSVLTRC